MSEATDRMRATLDRAGYYLHSQGNEALAVECLITVLDMLVREVERKT